MLIDSDRLAREVVAPGTDGLAEVTARFGADVIAADGSLDRAALGRMVFADDQARQDLEAIVHPRVQSRSADIMATAAVDAVIVHDIPLLVELHREGDYDLVVVVGAATETRVQRMVDHRGMSAEQARQRVAAQATDAQRRTVADIWITNEGTQSELQAEAVRIWREEILPRAGADGS